jgi:hypothetical protein
LNHFNHADAADWPDGSKSGAPAVRDFDFEQKTVLMGHEYQAR